MGGLRGAGRPVVGDRPERLGPLARPPRIQGANINPELPGTTPSRTLRELRRDRATPSAIRRSTHGDDATGRRKPALSAIRQGVPFAARRGIHRDGDTGRRKPALSATGRGTQGRRLRDQARIRAAHSTATTLGGPSIVRRQPQSATGQKSKAFLGSARNAQPDPRGFHGRNDLAATDHRTSGDHDPRAAYAHLGSQGVAETRATAPDVSAPRTISEGPRARRGPSAIDLQAFSRP